MTGNAKGGSDFWQGFTSNIANPWSTVSDIANMTSSDTNKKDNYNQGKQTGGSLALAALTGGGAMGAGGASMPATGAGATTANPMTGQITSGGTTPISPVSTGGGNMSKMFSNMASGLNKQNQQPALQTKYRMPMNYTNY